jgi:hypothetical protein
MPDDALLDACVCVCVCVCGGARGAARITSLGVRRRGDGRAREVAVNGGVVQRRSGADHVCVACNASRVGDKFGGWRRGANSGGCGGVGDGGLRQTLRTPGCSSGGGVCGRVADVGCGQRARDESRAGGARVRRDEEAMGFPTQRGKCQHGGQNAECCSAPGRVCRTQINGGGTFAGCGGVRNGQLGQRRTRTRPRAHVAARTLRPCCALVMWEGVICVWVVCASLRCAAQHRAALRYDSLARAARGR